MLKSLCNSIYRITSRKDLWFQQLQLYSIVAEVNTKDNSVNADEFSKKENVILKAVNKSNLTNLKKHTELANAKAIISCRTTGGLYKSLNDVMLRTKLESDVLDKLYDSINNHKARLKQLSYKNAIIPELTMEQVPETTLGIHIGQSMVTWASVTDKFEVSEWEYTPWNHGDPPKNSYDIIKLIEPVFKALPICQSYVTEDIYLKNISSISMLSCQKQLTVAIMACLKLVENHRTDDLLENSIYVLKPRTSARFHNLIVGSEIISPKYFIKKIINDTESSNNELEVVYINDVEKNKYLKANIYQQEEMSWCLLKALTFIHLVKSFTLNEKINME